MGGIAGSVSAAADERVEAATLHPVFLMVNSLETGGTERQFIAMARALRKAGTPVQLGCLMNQGPLARELEGLSEFPLGGSLYGVQSIRSRLQLRHHLLANDIHVAHAFDFYTNLTLIPAAKMAGIPVIGSQRQIGDLLTRRQFFAQLAVFGLCDRVVCNSREAAKRLVEAGLPPRKIVVIGNVLPDDAFAEIAPSFPAGQGTVQIGMIARMNAEYKNHRGFLRAAKLLRSRLSGVRFVLVGDGPLCRALEEEAAALGLTDLVEFLGNRRDVTALLRSFAITVVPSKSESLSNVMLESMAAAVPVVATAVGGNKELGENGRALLVPADDEESLATAMAQLLENKALRSEMVCAAREFVQANYSAERVCRQYQDLYAEVSSRKYSRSFKSNRRQSSSASAIHVAFIAPSLRYVGGQSVQADLLMKYWKQEPDLLAKFVPVDPRFPFGLRWAEQVPILRTVIREPLYLWRLWRALGDVDVAHIFSASYSSFLLAPLPAWLIARARGCKTLIHYHSGEARDHLRRSSIARHVLHKADQIVVPSGYLETVFHDFGIEAKAVPNIIDWTQFVYRRRDPVRPHLICTRGFHPYYGIDVVVRAFAQVLKQHPEAELDLVGGGPLEQSIRTLVRQLRLPHVNFPGVISRQEIGEIYDRGEVFVNASNLDNMPVSVLEAFAAGTPVVTTKPEGMDYLVTHERTGLLSEPGDSAALAQNILRVLGEPNLATRLAETAFEESSQYRWPAVRQRWLTLYAGLASHSRKAEDTLATTA